MAIPRNRRWAVFVVIMMAPETLADKPAGSHNIVSQAATVKRG
jgi:hypothetical protein